LNVQVPWELSGLNFAFVKVRIEDTVSELVNLPLSDYSPGVFESVDLGPLLAIVTHADGHRVTPQDPARPGETVVLYATGLGPVDATQETGEAAPTSPPAWSQHLPEVTVGGRAASVLFAGLTPGLAGLYQVNLRLAEDTPRGQQPLALRANGILSQAKSIPIQ
jgi:uncharacterized protein (TIGR03437 family)